MRRQRKGTRSTVEKRQLCTGLRVTSHMYGGKCVVSNWKSAFYLGLGELPENSIKTLREQAWPRDEMLS